MPDRVPGPMYALAATILLATPNATMYKFVGSLIDAWAVGGKQLTLSIISSLSERSAKETKTWLEIIAKEVRDIKDTP